MTYHLLRFTLKLISYIPFPLLYLLADVMAFLLYRVVRYRRAIVRRNLTECFPEMSLREVKALERRFYRFFADNMLESCKLATISPAEISRRMRFVNVADVNKVLAGGRSVALYLGHYANWEWSSSMPLHLEKGAVTAQIYHKLRNKNFDRLMLHIRGRMGATSVEMRKTARFATETIASGRTAIIGFIADQSPKKREVRDFIDFLHHRTPVLTGTEKIVKHYGFDAWYLDVRRVRRGYYEATFTRMAPNPAELPDYELTEIYYRCLERSIRRAPELYLWTHNRFKHATLIENGN